MSLRLVPIDLADANAFVKLHHRTHKPARGCKFCVGVGNEGGGLCGVAITSKPKAKARNDGRTLEVSRCCTDGTRNACSMLYRAAWRAARALGYRAVITYTKPSEGGASLRGAGFVCVGLTDGGEWNERDGRARDNTNAGPKLLWVALTTWANLDDFRS